MTDYGKQSVVYASVGTVFKDSGALDLYKSCYQELSDLHPKSGVNRVVRKVAGWRDPLTPPQSKVDCVKWCQITPWDKWCCGHAVRWRYMDCELFVEVTVATPQDVVKALEECLKEAVITAAIAAIVTAVLSGGSGVAAAKAAFVASLTHCLSNKLSDIVSVSLPQSCGWTDWQ